MKTLPPRIRQALPLLALATASPIFANGLAIDEQSASAMGTAYAGRASSALDASTLLGNPAGMSRLQQAQVSAGAAWISVDSDMDDARSDVPGVTGSSEGDMVPDSLVPSLYAATPLDERWHVGLGLYVPFALLDDYESDFIGRYRAQRSSLRIVTLQPTVSYRLHERLAIGFGPTINRADGELSNYLNFAGQDALLNVKGDDVGYGFNLGALAELTPSLSAGLTYRSRVNYQLRGHTTLSGVPALLPGLDALNGRYDAGLDCTTPELLETALSWRIDPRWTLHASAVWTRWSRLQQLVVENQNVPLAAFGSVQEAMDWRDTWSYALGASYQLNRDWLLRAGLSLDPTPTHNSVRSARIPVGDRTLLGLGAAWSVHAGLTLDLAYLYAHERTAKVSQAAQIMPTEAGPLPIQPGYYAGYRNSYQVLAAQLSWRL